MKHTTDISFLKSQITQFLKIISWIVIFPSEISSQLSTYLENGVQFSSLLLCACRVIVVDDTTMLGTIAIYGLLSLYIAWCMLQPAGLGCDCSRQINNARHNCYWRHFLHLVVVVFVLCWCFCTNIDVVGLLLLKWVLWAPPIIDCFELHLPKDQ